MCGARCSLASRVVGGTGHGVDVIGISRNIDLHLLNDRRSAQAATAGSDTRAEFLNALEDLIGASDAPGSLSDRIASFDAALIAATSRPESAARLSAVADAASALAGGLNAASDAIQIRRQNADAAIAAAVQTLNDSLKEVERLNTAITAHSGPGNDVSALLDQRAQAIDRISTILPVREIPREDGRVALMTTTGTLLIDGPAASFGFRRTPTIIAETTLASGALSGLTLNGRPAATDGAMSVLGDGELAALFDVRDQLAVSGQAGLDAFARDLVERFSDPALDPTLATGSPGIFTDAGLASRPAFESGLSGRIALNAAVDPDQGGSVTRLRDGLGATTPGPTGDARLLNALSTRLNADIATVSTGLPSGVRNVAELASDLISIIATDRLSIESGQSFAAARLTTLQDLESRESGVDVDTEMQSLLVIEKSYAANAKVLQTLDAMLNTLMEI
jgi:flagellar hook-associated protein 1 FlgK